MERYLAHGAAHDPATPLYAGYSWDEWVGLIAAAIGFVLVIALIIRRRHRSRAK